MAGKSALSEPGDSYSSFCSERTCVAPAHSPLAKGSHVAKPDVSEVGNRSLP